MFVLPLIYCTAFFAAIHALYKKRDQGVFLFIVFGLPIYTISLSVSYMFGLEKLIPFLQLFKEIIILFYQFLVIRQEDTTFMKRLFKYLCNIILPKINKIEFVDEYYIHKDSILIKGSEEFFNREIKSFEFV